MGFNLRRRERVVFLGDSITEQHGFSNMVETWLSLREKTRRLSFFNAGWGGDTSPGALARLDRDVLDLKPTLVVICLGMNDGGYGVARPEITARYIDHLEKIIARLKKSRARVILLSNGFADIQSSADFLKPVDYSRGALVQMVKAALALARRHKLPQFDLHTLMTRVDRAAKRADKKFSMVPDGFHPDPAGHLVMAYGALKALGFKNSSSMQRVKAHAKVWGYEAEFRLENPPFFVEAAARKVLPFLDFQKTFNHHRLAFSGLKPGRYVLQCGAWKSPAFSATQLQKGIAAASFWDAPFLKFGNDLQIFVNGMRDIYSRYWRALGMSGGYGAYRAKLHRLGIKAMPALEASKRELALQRSDPIKLRILPAALNAEVLKNGEFIGPWQFSQAFQGDFKRDRLKGGKAKWKPVRVDTNNPTHCFGMVLGRLAHCVAYAKTSLESPIDQRADLMLGSGDGYEAWLNGRLLASKLGLRRTSFPDQERYEVDLKKGRNQLLIKVSQKEIQWWGFHARFQKLKAPILASN